MIPDNWLNDFENDREFDPDEAVANIKQILWRLGTFIAMLIVFALTSCKTTEYVPVEVVKVEKETVKDTIIQKDTIREEKETVIREASKGDSALLAKLGLQLSESNKIILVLQDKLKETSHNQKESHSDTIYRYEEEPVPYPVEKKVEKELSWWQKTQMRGFWLLLLIALLALGWKYRKKIKAFIKCLIG